MHYITSVLFFSIQNLRGINEEQKMKYILNIHAQRNIFTCFDGSKEISLDRLNDGYCDCKDGSDEPGTNACNNGVFYCKNYGSYPKIIPKSYVGDGVCDCCDGSDEYNNPFANCSDVCGYKQKKSEEIINKLRNLTHSGTYNSRSMFIRRGQLEYILRKKQHRIVNNIIDFINKYIKYANKVYIEYRKRGITKKEMTTLKERSMEISRQITEYEMLENRTRKGERKIKKFISRQGRFNKRIKAKQVFNVENSPVLLPDFQPVIDKVLQIQEMLKVIYKELKNNIDEKMSDYFNKIGFIAIELPNITRDIYNIVQSDFGIDKEYLPLYGQSFIYRSHNTFYELLPFVEVRKFKNNDFSNLDSKSLYKSCNSLRWYYNSSIGYRASFSAEVRLHCGEYNKIINIKESTDGKYIRMDFTTPAACNDEYYTRVSRLTPEEVTDWAYDSGLIN